MTRLFQYTVERLVFAFNILIHRKQMKMKLAVARSALSVCVVGLLIASSANAGDVLFRFSDGTEFDSSAVVGTTMTRDEGGTENPITLTSVDIQSPEYIDDGNGGLVWNGSYLEATTHIAAGTAALGINNPGATPFTNESQDIHVGESWVIEFSRPVVIEEINFASLAIATGDQLEVTIADMPPILFNSSNSTLDSSSDITDPFSGLVIPAGVDIKFEGLDSNMIGEVSAWRVNAITVSEAPAAIRALVHPVSGEVLLYNDSFAAVGLASYQINSLLGALKPGDSDWNSLTDRNLNPVDGGDDPGETWQESGSISSSILAEAFLLGSTAIDAYDTLSIGNAYDSGLTDENMTMTYFDRAAGVALDGTVEIVVLGDMDGSGDLEEADVNPFVQALTDRAAFETAYPGVVADFYGDFNGNGKLDLGDIQGFKLALAALSASSSAGSTVPEPSTLVLLSLALIACTQCRRKQ